MIECKFSLISAWLSSRKLIYHGFAPIAGEPLHERSFWLCYDADMGYRAIIDSESVLTLGSRPYDVLLTPKHEPPYIVRE